MPGQVNRKPATSAHIRTAQRARAKHARDIYKGPGASPRLCVRRRRQARHDGYGQPWVLRSGNRTQSDRRSGPPAQWWVHRRARNIENTSRHWPGGLRFMHVGSGCIGSQAQLSPCCATVGQAQKRESRLSEGGRQGGGARPRRGCRRGAVGGFCNAARPHCPE